MDVPYQLLCSKYKQSRQHMFYTTFCSFDRTIPSHFVRLDQDILSPLAGKRQLFTYETRDFWEQIKTPG